MSERGSCVLWYTNDVIKIYFMNQIKSLLRGVGQVMLQNNAVTGLLFLLGIFYNSLIMGVGAVTGLLSATLAAVLFKYSNKDIVDGLYGFNGVLVGIAMLFFYQSSVLVFCLIIIGSVFSTWVMNFMMVKKWRPYTFPFILATWILILLVKFLHLADSVGAGGMVVNSSTYWLSATSMGFGQVMFQGSIVTGLIFFIAILINSKMNAAYGLLGSVLGILFGLVFSLPLSLINIGIFGYNGVLCGIALGDKNKKSFGLAVLAIILSSVILVGFNLLGWSALTAPFVFATWIVLYFSKFVV